MAASSRFLPATLASLSVIVAAAIWQNWPAEEAQSSAVIAARSQVEPALDSTDPDRLSPQAQAAYVAQLKAMAARRG